MKTTYAMFLATSGFVLSAATLSAQVLAYDGFTPGTDQSVGEYIADPGGDSTNRYQLITGQNPVIDGFTGNWSTSSTPFELGSTPISTLTYSDGTNSLVTSGSAVFRNATSGQSSRALDISGLTTDGNTFYFSFLMQSGNAANVGSLEFAENSTGTGGGLRINNDGTNYSTTAGGTKTTLFTSDSDTHLFVWKLETGATDSWSLWVDPTDLTAESTPTVTGSATGIDISHIVLSKGLGTGSLGVVFDEVRIGTTWGSVTPIPESSTFALLGGMAALALVVVRRRRS